MELPIGTTEDRLVGSIDLAAALTGGEVRFSPGLLAAAHGGVLYVDEVNLLPDHLVDVLLDVAVSGINRVEREGVSHVHPSRFVLVGSMNPEEGDLRPQLLDRFGLAADVLAPSDPAERAEAVRRRMAFDADPAAFTAAWPDEPLSANPPAALPEALVHQVSALCASVGAEGLRADLVICRAAAALAGLEGRTETTVDDVRRVAPLALAHRRRRHPFEDPGMAEEEIDQALEQAAAEADQEPDQDRVAPRRAARTDHPAGGAADHGHRRRPALDGRGPERPVGRRPRPVRPARLRGHRRHDPRRRRPKAGAHRSTPPTCARPYGSSGPGTS